MKKIRRKSFDIGKPNSELDQKNYDDFKWSEAMHHAELEYLNDMLPQLKIMAERMGERTLGYIIGLAAAEARTRLEVHDYLSEGD